MPYFFKRAGNENCPFHCVCKQWDHQKQMLLAVYLNKDQLPPGSPPLHLICLFRNKNEGITSVWTKKNCKDLQKRKMAPSFLIVLCCYLRDSQAFLVYFSRSIKMALCTETLGLACNLNLKDTVTKSYLTGFLPFSFNFMQYGLSPPAASPDRTLL